ncbi:hypothetical protein BH10PAT3_BH10PAT3_6380 [soil metagenome]
MKLRSTIATTLITATSFLSMASVAHAAGTATFSLSPASASYNNGNTFSLTISENSAAQTVNSVQADITFDSSKLKYNGFSAGSLSCPIVQAGTGSLSVGCNVTGVGVTNGQTVGSVSFTTLAGSGNTSVVLAQSSLIAHPDSDTSSSDIWNHGAVSTNFTLTTPVAPPVAPPAPTGSQDPTPVTAAAVRTSATSNTGTIAPTEVPEAQVLGASTNTKAATGKTVSPVVAKATVPKSHMGWVWAGIIAVLAAAAFAYNKYFHGSSPVANKVATKTKKA